MSSSAAIGVALNAPPLLKPQATIDAIQIIVLKKAMDQQGQAALQLLQAVVAATVDGKGSQVNIQA